MVKPKSKTVRAHINQPTEHMLKIRATQMGTSKEKLIGYILTDWARNCPNDKCSTFEQAQGEIGHYF